MRDKIRDLIVHILLRFGGLIIVALFLTWAWLGAKAWAADYCIHPSGSQSWPNCVAGAGPTCTGLSAACTLSAANANLAAGDRALLMGGTYNERLSPQNSGTSDANRITYQAYDTTTALFVNCAGNDNSVGGSGCINIAERDYIHITGLPPGEAEGSGEYFLIAPTSGGRNAFGMTISGAQFSILDHFRIESCQTALDTCRLSRLLVAEPEAYPTHVASRSTEYIWMHNFSLLGSMDVSNNAQLVTYDGLVLERGTNHILMEKMLAETVRHTLIKLSASSGHAFVLRDSYVYNAWKSAFEFYLGGRLRASPNKSRMNSLVENSFFRATANNTSMPPDNAGQALKLGAGHAIVRYNVNIEANHPVYVENVHTTGNNFGHSNNFHFGNHFNRVYYNVYAKPHGTCYYMQNNGESAGAVDPDIIGSNYFRGNIFFDCKNPNNNYIIGYGSYPNAGIPLGQGDVYVGNVMGLSGQTSSWPVIRIPGAGQVSLQTAKGFNDPDPQFRDWNGHANIYDGTLNTGPNGFVNYLDANPTADSFDLLPGSIYRDAGPPLAIITSVTDTTNIVVDDSNWFYAEAKNFEDNAPWIPMQMDWICVSQSATDYTSGQRGCAQLDIVQDSGAMSLRSAISGMQTGDFVWLYRRSNGDVVIDGTAPDIGGGDSTGIAPVVAEVTPVITPTSDLVNDFTFSITDPDSSSFTLVWGGGCLGPTTSNTTGNQTVQVSVASEGTYNCTLLINDGGLVSNLLNMTPFEVQTWVALDMDLSAWRRIVFPEDPSITDDQACSVANGTSGAFGTTIEVGPYLAGQFDICRVENAVNIASNGIIGIRGQYRTTNSIAWQHTVGSANYVASVRSATKRYELPSAPNWAPFEIYFYHPYPNTDEVKFWLGLKKRANNNLIEFAALEYTLTPPPESYASTYPSHSKSVPPSRAATGRFEFVNTAGDEWTLFDHLGNPVAPPSATPRRDLIDAITPELEQNYTDIEAMNYASITGNSVGYNMGVYADGQGTRVLPYNSASEAEQTGGFVDLERSDGQTLDLPDPWDPAFATAITTQAQRIYDAARGVNAAPQPDRFIFARMENEPDSKELHRYPYSAFAGPQFVAHIDARYNSDIAALNAAWGKSYSSFDDILTDKPDPELHQGTIYDDFESFESVILQQYFSVIYNNTRAIFTTENICSPAFATGSAYMWIKHGALLSDFDCVIVNIYPNWYAEQGAGASSIELLDNIYAATQKPIVIQEYSFPAMDSGLYDTPPFDFSWSQVVDTQQNRSYKATNWAAGLYNLPYITIVRWYRWRDYKIPDNSSTRNANRGLYDANAVAPYTELVDALTSQNAMMLSLFAASTCPKDATDGSYVFNAAICLPAAAAGELHVGKAQGGPFTDACGTWAVGNCASTPDCPSNVPVKCSTTVNGVGAGVDYWLQWQSPAGTVVREEPAPKRIQ